MDNISALIEEIKSKGAKRVLIQLPEGLKTDSSRIVEKMEKEGITAFVHNNPSYGACDLADKTAKQLSCDLLVHVGHNKFYREFGAETPVLYFPWIMDVSLDGIDFSVIGEGRIGLVTNIQHLHLLDDVKKNMEATGKKIVIGGQLLGCWTANATKIENEIDAYLFVGSGVFHSLALKTDKKVYGLDLEARKIEAVDLSILEKRRWARIFKARDARIFGILVSTKGGQFNLIGNAERIKRELEEKGKRAVILTMDEVRDERLLGVKVDAFINTACPRIADDVWSKPFVNATDVNLLFE